MPAKTTPEAEANAEATSNSPIVTLSWVGTPILVDSAPSTARQGYAVKLRAESFTITRVNGTVEARKPKAGSSFVSVALSHAHEADIASAIIADAEALIKANATLDPDKAVELAEAKLWNAGTFTFGIHGRAARVKPTSMAARIAKANAEAKAKAEAEAKAKAEAKDAEAKAKAEAKAEAQTQVKAEVK